MTTQTQLTVEDIDAVVLAQAEEPIEDIDSAVTTYDEDGTEIINEAQRQRLLAQLARGRQLLVDYRLVCTHRLDQTLNPDRLIEEAARGKRIVSPWVSMSAGHVAQAAQVRWWALAVR